MPYKHEYTHTKLPSNLDRRIKLTEEDKIEIKKLISITSLSDTAIGEQYGVSRKTIRYIRNPDKHLKDKEAYKLRRLDGRYYNKDNHKEAIKSTRKHKQENFNLLIKEND